MPITNVGLLDEHGPSLVLPSYSHECIADWIRSDADLLRNALAILRGYHAHPSAPWQAEQIAAAAAAAASQAQKLQKGVSGVSISNVLESGWAGRLDATQFLPSGHGGKDMSISFNFWLPPPYRVVLLVALGLLAFACNLHVLKRLGLDPATLPNFTAESVAKGGGAGGGGGLPQHRPLTGGASAQEGEAAKATTMTSTPGRIRALAMIGTLYTILSLGGWIFFRSWADGPAQGDPFGYHAQAYQGAVFLGAALVALWPTVHLYGRQRWTFVRSMLRIARPTLRQRISFGDLLLADILTSFAKVFGDVWLALCFLWPRREHHTWWNGRGSLVVPIMTSLPYLIRLRQCLSEYATSQPTAVHALTQAQTGGGSGSGGRRSRKPLANALKYASALPVIWLSTLHEAASDVRIIELDARIRTPEELASGLLAWKDAIFQLW